MSWNQKESAIKEKRTIEATKKNMMGPSGKLGIIVKAWGHPVMRESMGGLCDANYLDDPYDDPVTTEYDTTVSGQNGPVAWRDEIPEGNFGAGEAVDGNPNFEGYVFDGLSRGLHFEIHYKKMLHELKVYYKGFEVYKEVGGELEAYAPFPEWEGIVERLYKKAKVVWQDNKQLEQEALMQEVNRRKHTFWQKLRMRWGI